MQAIRMQAIRMQNLCIILLAYIWIVFATAAPAALVVRATQRSRNARSGSFNQWRLEFLQFSHSGHENKQTSQAAGPVEQWVRVQYSNTSSLMRESMKTLHMTAWRQFLTYEYTGAHHDQQFQWSNSTFAFRSLGILAAGAFVCLCLLFWSCGESCLGTFLELRDFGFFNVSTRSILDGAGRFQLGAFWRSRSVPTWSILGAGICWLQEINEADKLECSDMEHFVVFRCWAFWMQECFDSTLDASWGVLASSILGAGVFWLGALLTFEECWVFRLAAC